MHVSKVFLEFNYCFVLFVQARMFEFFEGVCNKFLPQLAQKREASGKKESENL